MVYFGSVLYLWLIACFHQRLVAALQSNNLPGSELHALNELFLATNGSFWDWKPVNETGNVWNFTADCNPCAQDWQGVTCTNQSSESYLHVIKLDLTQYNLDGTLPAAIGNLTYLEVLSLPHNKLNGPIPDSPWATMPNLSTLDLGRNRLHGAIAPALGQLQHLISLKLNFNRLNGTIPASLGDATGLVNLYLDNNRLSGQIPSSLGQLTHLQYLWLVLNRLTGTLPSSIGDVGSLKEFVAGQNQIRGSIPSEYGQLSNLTVLDMDFNALTGSIQPALCALSQLELLMFNDNDLTGTLPGCLSSLLQLRVLFVADNALHGTLPSVLGDLHQLEALQLDDNAFSGTIPEVLCGLTSLLSLYLENNMLTSTIPNCLGELSLLEHFAAERNALVGTIPAVLGQLPRLITLWLQNNYLTGPMPDFGGQHNLTEITVAGNLLTGTIPDCFQALSALKIVNFSTNSFTGPIPTTVRYLSAAQLLFLDNNLLTGTLPTGLTGLGNVLQLYLNNNQLSGSLDGVFNASTQVAMLNVFLNDNQLTGTLPDELFQLPKLNTIVAQGNCFTGTLSAAMCESPAMVSLILDGLHTSPACRNDLLTTTNSYTTMSNVHGTIPACLFGMPYLVSLHLAGNGLTGPLPELGAISAQLVDMAVSHNILTGTIPATIQERGWLHLDLSYNRLHGSLLDSLGGISTKGAMENDSETSIAVQNNRLSGRIPSSLVHLQNVSVLGSNLFDCKIDKSDLPKHDSDRDNYQCGSDAFNGPFYVVLALTIALMAVAAVGKYARGWSAPILIRIMSAIGRWKISAGSLPRHLSHVVNMSNILCQLAVLCTALILVLLVPWYAAASHFYGTYAHQYAWVVSAGFLSGVTPLAAELVLFCAMVAALVIGATFIVARADAEERHRSRSSARYSGSTVAAAVALPVLRPSWQRALAYLAFLSVNMYVVVGVNAGFVAIALTQSNDVLILAQILLSLFKLTWNTICTPYLIALTAHFVSPAEKHMGESLTTLQILIGLFNNIAIPCLVVAVLSPSCFYGVFDAAPAVTSNYFIAGCAGAEFTHCSYNNPTPLTSTFSPPFRYDYQCSSSFITYYAPAFVYLGLAASIGPPILSALGLMFLRRAEPEGWWVKHLSRAIPTLWFPESVVAQSAPEKSSGDAAERPPISCALGMLCEARGVAVFDANNFVISLITYLGILLTFGVVFPPLAVVMCATMLSVAWQTKLSLGRFLHFAREQGAPQLAEALDRDCKGAVSLVILRASIFLIMCFACCFYALFLFDTLGDAVGLRGAYWVLIVMPLFPIVLISALRGWRHFDVLRGGHQLGASVNAGAFELQPWGFQGEIGTTRSSAQADVVRPEGADPDGILNALHN